MVIKTREHLAAVKPSGKALLLELMHFPDELVNPSELKLPGEKAVGQKELKMAESLIEGMSGKWEPEEFKDDYREALMEVIEKKIAAGGKELPAAKGKARKATNVVDLVAVLQQSLEQARGGKKKPEKKRRKAA